MAEYFEWLPGISFCYVYLQVHCNFTVSALADFHYAVYISLPTSLHLEWALKSAQKKKHILLEKPPALSVQDLDIIIEACNTNGVQLMDGTMWMHHRRTHKMKQLL